MKPLRRSRSRLAGSGVSTVSINTPAPRVRRAPEHVEGHVAVALDVDLEPEMVGDACGDVLEIAAGRGAEREGQVGRRRGVGQRRIRARPGDVGHAGRADAEGAVEGLAEEGRLLVPRGDVHQIAGRHRYPAEAGNAAGETPFILDRAVDIVEDDPGQTPPRGRAQLLDVDGFRDIHWLVSFRKWRHGAAVHASLPHPARERESRRDPPCRPSRTTA